MKKTIIITLILIIFLFINNTSPVKSFLPSDSPKYDSNWNSKELNVVKLILHINGSSELTPDLNCYVFWRLVTDNGTLATEQQIINKTIIRVDKTLLQWRVLVWCLGNVSCTIFRERNNLTINFELPPLSETLSDITSDLLYWQFYLPVAFLTGVGTCFIIRRLKPDHHS